MSDSKAVPASNELDCLKDRFTVAVRNGFWVVSCNFCHVQWRLEKEPLRPGDLLHLLNHTASHGSTPEIFISQAVNRMKARSESTKILNEHTSKVLKDWTQALKSEAQRKK
jgi:hypothetical protein